jgi:two-component system sensor histidine kinase/response regulator
MLCKEFLEKNKGQLHIESEKGKGSIFSFTLPRASD